LSEPEDRIARRLIARVHPDVSIWFHQPLALVVRSAGDITIQRRFARRVGLPLVRLVGRYPGSVTSWQNHWHPEAAAFVVELPSGSLAPTAVDRYVNAIVNAATDRSAARAGRSFGASSLVRPLVGLQAFVHRVP